MSLKMTEVYHKFGETTIAKVSDASELKQVLVDPWLESDTIIIKPNWVACDKANFTDVKSMRMLLEALDSNFVVTESLHIGRSLDMPKEEMQFTVNGTTVDWTWLLMGKGWRWLFDKPNWDWFRREGHWDMIKKHDQAFLDDFGFTDLFDEFNVEYINVTNEVWNGRVADPAEIRRLVEKRFKPLELERLYTLVPRRLYDLRGSTFISFAKLKMYATFTLKNLFGMIPDPARPWWHGPKDSRLVSSIIGINKIYHTLFNVYGICEAFYEMSFHNPEGEFVLTLPRMRYTVKDDFGFVAFGRNLVAIDTILFNLINDLIFVAPGINIAPIEKAQEEFGVCEEEILEKSRKKVRSWFLLEK